MEIKLDHKSLPADKQRVRFQVVMEELYGIWHEGVYVADEDIFRVDDEVWYDIWSEIVRWEPID
ncbi:hypothetical protein TH53_12630 [Pedobacter lusitanus]|uniref:Contig53, whole genome shotgun sequence n=1 Tax=Pedobacter lusitanus TaxID=1503925 RepID=A0A0D0FWK7_9SPHI|nr:hypothetical protein [Pedobacter lusitanus]KIO76844.1 hypothetical protein TH53_12630 [Pedobacter lusitanus]